MKKELTGIDGTLGATQGWESSIEDVGIGSQTIAKMEAPILFETDLQFIEPQFGKAKGYTQLKPELEGTTVTWGFSSKLPYPFNLTLLVMDMEKHMGEDWEYALTTLKDMCEK